MASNAKPGDRRMRKVARGEEMQMSNLGENPSSVDFAKEQQDARPSVVAPFKERGQAEVEGVAYYDYEDIEDVAKKDVTLVGVSYQVSSMAQIDSVAEVFQIVLDISLMYAIDDLDYQWYEEYIKRGSITFQEIVDDGKVIVQPPIFEVRNAVEAPETNSERVSGLLFCYDHRKQEWSWCVTAYAQLRVICREEFEMQTFPFTRNAMQVQLQAKQSVDKLLLVPYNARSAMPHHMWAGGEVKETFLRTNSFKTNRSPCNWVVDGHHAAFVPKRLLQYTASGSQFSMCLITVQLQQRAHFYLWNTVPVVFCLPLLSGLCIVADPGSIADRMSIVLTLLLTMATYKVSLAAWIPQKDYNTYMDWYMLAGFAVILAIGLMVGVSKYRTMNLDDDQAVEAVLMPELIFVTTVQALWVIPHLALLCGAKLFTSSWGETMRGEEKSLSRIFGEVKQERDVLCDAKWVECEKPQVPQRIPVADSGNIVEDHTKEADTDTKKA